MNKMMKKTLPLIALCFLAACSDSSSSKSKSAPESIQNEIIAADGSNVNGIYATEMWPINYNLHLKQLGMVSVSRSGDMFEARMNLKYAPKSTVLKTAIYTARRCPNINDDLNKDAYIDILEARVAIGKITIPFDNDLDSQMGGHSFSASGEDGKYAYHQSASFERLFADLKAEDENPSDEMIKIGPEDGLTFPGRIVLVQGLTESIPLPATVATSDGESSHQSIPVACGVLWKVQELPAELNI
jgi:hypothetical protein